MKCSVDSLSKAQKKLVDAINVMAQSYKCDWNDDVHASYQAYVSTCKESVNTVANEIAKCKNICETVNSLTIDADIALAETLIAQEAAVQ